MDSGRFDNMTESIIIIYPILLLEAFGNQSSFMMINRAIWFVF
jgi:hypothetical protein